MYSSRFWRSGLDRWFWSGTGLQGHPARLFFTSFYILSAFFMFALHAATLDAPTLVFQEYNENFVAKGANGSKAVASDERVVRNYLERHMRDVPNEKLGRMTKLILRLARKHKLPPGLILSVVKVESNFQPWAMSPRGALGLMQIMPETGQWIADKAGVSWDGPATLLNEEANLTMGVWYLAFLRDKYDGDLKKMLSAYNRGPAKVDEELASGQEQEQDSKLAYYHKVRQALPKPLL